MSGTVDSHAAYDNVVAILRHDVPKETLVDGDALYQHVLAVYGCHRHGQQHGVSLLSVTQSLCNRFRDINAFLHYQVFPVFLIYLAVGRWANDASTSRQSDILGSVGINHCSERHYVVALVACGHGRLIVFDVAAEGKHGSVAQVQAYARLQLYASASPLAVGDDNRATALPAHAVDSRLYMAGGKSSFVHLHRGRPIGKHRATDAAHVERCRDGFHLCRHVLWTGLHLLRPGIQRQQQ